jgi:flagellar biosynthesis/type III secretory pathway ATPase
MREVSAQVEAYRTGQDFKVDLDMDALQRITDFVRQAHNVSVAKFAPLAATARA